MNKIYGIDLGTTNSLIGCDGHLISSLVSSKVNLKTRECVSSDTVGDDVLGSYKVNMGLGSLGETPRDASSIVLENLCKVVKDTTGDIVKDVVISVPAYFSHNQRMAVKESANKIGLNLISVINEPTAAALHICSKKGNEEIRRGVFVVYDLGGGTFDCTIIDSRLGKYHIVATDGCILGGDDLDKLIAEYVMQKLKISRVLRDSLTESKLVTECTKCKLMMQKAYKDFKNDNYEYAIKIPIKFYQECKQEYFNLTLGEYKELVKQTFKPTIQILSNLIDSKIPKGTDFKVIFVGGSTWDLYLCSYVLESANVSYKNAEYDTSPDFSVAMGVCKYAQVLQNGGDDLEFKDVTKQLSVEDNDGSAIVIVPANTNIPCSLKKMITNAVDTSVLQVKLYQGNSVVAKNNEFLGILAYEYEEEMMANEGDVEVTVSVDINGFITLEVEDIINFGDKKQITLRSSI